MFGLSMVVVKTAKFFFGPFVMSRLIGGTPGNGKGATIFKRRDTLPKGTFTN